MLKRLSTADITVHPRSGNSKYGGLSLRDFLAVPRHRSAVDARDTPSGARRWKALADRFHVFIRAGDHFWHPASLEDAVASSELPVHLTPRGWKPLPIHWLYQGAIYETRVDLLEPADVKALALETENKTKLKLARARFLMEASEALGAAREGRRGREPIPDEVKVFVWNRDGGQCVKCGSQANLEFDHIIPLSKGGSNSSRNIQILCETHNREKGGNLA